MKKVFLVGLITLFLIAGCGSDEFKLQKDTPEYALAKALSEKVEYFNPDKNNVLVKTKNFDLTVGETIKNLVEGMGSRADGLKSLTPDRLKDYLTSMAKRFAEQKILLKKAEEAGIQVTPAEIDSVLKLQYARSGGEERFKQILDRSGIQFDFIKADLTKNLKIEKYFNKAFDAELKVTDDDIKKSYDEDKTATVRHILLRTQGKSDSAKQEIHKKMEKILEEAKSGKDFAELAKKYSEDPGSKSRGGLYENFERGAMVKPFDEASFTLPIGEISDIVETRYGYHIIKVLDRKRETQPFDMVKDQIRQKLISDRKNKLIPDYLDKLKEEVGFEVVDF